MYGVGYWIILFLRSVLFVAKCDVCTYSLIYIFFVCYIHYFFVNIAYFFGNIKDDTSAYWRHLVIRQHSEPMPELPFVNKSVAVLPPFCQVLSLLVSLCSCRLAYYVVDVGSLPLCLLRDGWELTYGAQTREVCEAEVRPGISTTWQTKTRRLQTKARSWRCGSGRLPRGG